MMVVAHLLVKLCIIFIHTCMYKLLLKIHLLTSYTSTFNDLGHAKLQDYNLSVAHQQ